MATVGSEIENYTGNAGLGLGSNADVPAIYSDNNVINQTGRDLMQINHDNNVRLWEQKVKDRNQSLKDIDNGQVATGAIRDDDRTGVINPLQKKADDALLLKAKNPNDKDAAMAYQKAMGELKNAVTWAQHRYIGTALLQKDKAAALLPKDQQRIQDSLDEQAKLPFYQGEFQQPQSSLTYDWDGKRAELLKDIDGSSTGATSTTTTQIPGKPTTVRTTVKSTPIGKVKGANVVASDGGGVSVGTITKPDGSVYQVSQRKIDFDKIKQNAADDYNDDSGVGFQGQKVIRDADEALPDNLYEPQMKHILQRAIDYNNNLGLQPSGNENYKGLWQDPATGYIDPKALADKLGIDPNTGARTGGKIMMTTPDYVALKTLASINGNYAPKTETYDKDQSEFGLKKGLNDANIFYKNALGNAALKKANAYAAHMAAKINSMKGTDEEQNQFIDEIYNRNLTQQSTLIQGDAKNPSKAGLISIPADKSLPVFTFDGKSPKQLKPIGSTDVKDNAGHITGYKGGHYDQQYIYQGKPLTLPQLRDMYIDFKDENGANWTGSFDDYLKGSINSNRFDVRLIGADGSTDKKLSKAALKAISNKVTKKDQEGVFTENAPTDEQAQTE